MNRQTVLMAALVSLSVVLLACADFEGGKAAYRRGDYAGAYQGLKALAEQGDAEAQAMLGHLYYTGYGGVPQDYFESAKWYRKAAEQGNVDAQARLGVMCGKGQGVPQNDAEAEKWLRIAAVRGHNHAQDLVAKITAAKEESLRNSTRQGNSNLGVRSTEIPLSKQRGVYELPVKINGVISLHFILDTGASEVTIPADVALTLLRTGTITQRDFLPGKAYELADGSVVQSSRFILRELDLGGIRITQVPASIAPATASLLLGQSFLTRIESWELDNNRHVFIIRGVKK